MKLAYSTPGNILYTCDGKNTARKKGKEFPVCNLESDGMLPRNEAIETVKKFIADRKKDGAKVIAVIHGYGSSGVGGIIGEGMPKFLQKEKDDGRIRAFALGTEYTIWHPLWGETEPYRTFVNELNRNASNEGVTFVFL